MFMNRSGIPKLHRFTDLLWRRELLIKINTKHKRFERMINAFIIKFLIAAYFILLICIYILFNFTFRKSLIRIKNYE